MLKKVSVHSKCPNGESPNYSHRWETRELIVEGKVKRMTWCNRCTGVAK